MASTASSSSPPVSMDPSRDDSVIGSAVVGQTGSTEQQHQRPQAGPLPIKTPRLVGEIGYSHETAPAAPAAEDLGDDQEENDGEEDSIEGLNAAEADARNGRHPADRSHVNLASQSTASLPNPNSPHTARPSVSNAPSNTSTKKSHFSFHSLSSRLSAHKFGGISLITLFRLASLICFLSGLIVAWIFATQHLNKAPYNTANSPQSNGTSAIFIHVTFTIFTLLLIIFIERAIFQLRAERYAHLHPGMILPSHRHSHTTGRLSFPDASGRGNPAMAFAPWNRLPLPTYAAALGMRGTGDVEDAIIAAPPPPAYGNTRGSTLILASFLRSNSRASSRSHTDAQRGSATSALSMPISYAEVEHHRDVERARMLEEALAKLEENARSGERVA